MAISFILLLVIALSLFSIEFRIEEAIAKICTDAGSSSETTTTCGSQDSNAFTPSLQGREGNTKDFGNDGDSLMPHTNPKHFNHESHDGDSENDTPFTLPFP